jgi:hypothetical protein
MDAVVESAEYFGEPRIGGILENERRKATKRRCAPRGCHDQLFVREEQMPEDKREGRACGKGGRGGEVEEGGKGRGGREEVDWLGFNCQVR